MKASVRTQLCIFSDDIIEMKDKILSPHSPSSLSREASLETVSESQMRHISENGTAHRNFSHSSRVLACVGSLEIAPKLMLAPGRFCPMHLLRV